LNRRLEFRGFSSIHEGEMSYGVHDRFDTQSGDAEPVLSTYQLQRLVGELKSLVPDRRYTVQEDRASGVSRVIVESFGEVIADYALPMVLPSGELVLTAGAMLRGEIENIAHAHRAFGYDRLRRR
jgi:hypothetical protein